MSGTSLSDILQIKLLKIYQSLKNLGPLMKMLLLLFLLLKNMEACTLQPDKKIILSLMGSLSFLIVEHENYNVNFFSYYLG